MILGIGTDLCAIDRIDRTLNQFGDRFCDRLFTMEEQIRCDKNPNRRASRYAQHFAAKEACAKALGTGLREGVFWRDMILSSLPSGQPMLKLENGAKTRALKLIPDGLVGVCDISLTDESQMVSAVVILHAMSYEQARYSPNPFIIRHYHGEK